MELELKHLSAYLPYGLKGLKISKGNFKTDPNIEEIIDLTISDIGAFLKKRYHVISCKPILRPLSMLDKEIEVNGERFIPMIKLAKIQFPNVDFTIENDYCEGRLNVGVVIEFVIEDEIPFYKEYHNNIFGQSKSENCDDMYVANLKPSEIREKLLEWHFDIFGLIDAGLAIEMEVSHGR